MKRKLFLKSAVGLFATPLVFKVIKPYWGNNRDEIKTIKFSDKWSLSAEMAKIRAQEYIKMRNEYQKFFDEFYTNYCAAAGLPEKIL